MENDQDGDAVPLSAQPEKKARKKLRISFSDEDIEKMHEYFSEIPEAPKKQRRITTKKELLQSLSQTIAVLRRKNYSAPEICRMLTEKCAVNIFTKDVVPIIKGQEETAKKQRPEKGHGRKRKTGGIETEETTGVQSGAQLQGRQAGQANDGILPSSVEEPGQEPSADATRETAATGAENGSQESAPAVRKKSGSFSIEPDIEI